MKKLMIALVAVVVATVVNAGTVTWSSGNLYAAAGTEGGWNNADLTQTFKALGYEASMSVYFIAAEELAGYQAMSQSELYDAFSGKGADLTGSNKVNGVLQAGITIKDEAATGKEYGVVIATYHDTALDKDYYIANAVASTWTAATSKGAASNTISAQAANGGWQTEAIPEPTSGLLILLGLAGIALRRRHA